MNLQAYQLHPDFSDLFLMNTKNSIESILVFPRSVQYNILYDATATKNELPRNAGGYGSYAPSWDLLASFLCTDGLPIDESPLFDPHNPFKNRDPRCTATIVEFGTHNCLLCLLFFLKVERTNALKIACHYFAHPLFYIAVICIV